MHKIEGKNVLKASKGRVSGTGIVHDKDGKVKGTIRFDAIADMSKEEFEKLFGDVPVVKEEEETDSGTDTHSSGS